MPDSGDSEKVKKYFSQANSDTPPLSLQSGNCAEGKRR